MSSDSDINKTLKEINNNPLPTDNISFSKLVDKFLKKYYPKNENGEVDKEKLEELDEFSQYLRVNQELLYKLLKLDEKTIPDLLVNNYIGEVNIVFNPLEVKKDLDEFLINKIVNFDLSDEKVSQITPCVLIYYDIQQMHCLSCGEKMMGTLIDMAKENYNIKDNEIAFAYIQRTIHPIKIGTKNN